MSALDEEFFNLLDTSESLWTTLLIDGRTWIDVPMQNLAWQAHIGRMNETGSRFAAFRKLQSDTDGGTEASTVAPPLENQQTWRLWASPQRRRAQYVVGEGIVDVVHEGSTFWSNGNGKSLSNGGKENFGHGQGDGRHLIDTADYVSLLQIADISEGEKLGRHTINARVTLLDVEPHMRGPGVHGLTVGAPDFLELHVDRERGIVLGASSWFRESLYRVVELTKCEFDLVFARDAFEIKPEFGAEWESV